MAERFTVDRAPPVSPFSYRPITAVTIRESNGEASWPRRRGEVVCRTIEGPVWEERPDWLAEVSLEPQRGEGGRAISPTGANLASTGVRDRGMHAEHR